MTESIPKNEWETPQWLYDALDEQFHFQADLACTIENCKAPAGFTKNGVFYKTINGCFDVPDCDYQRLDSLQQPWNHTGYAWLNPPYSKPLPWIQKAHEDTSKYGNAVMMLLRVDTGSKAWQEIILPYASTIVFIGGRLKFEMDGIEVKGSPNFCTALVIFSGGRRWEINHKFEEIGVKFRLYTSERQHIGWWTPKKPEKEDK